MGRFGPRFTWEGAASYERIGPKSHGKGREHGPVLTMVHRGAGCGP